jgi:hypothetical protein
MFYKTKVWECSYRDEEGEPGHKYMKCWLSKRPCTYDTKRDDFALCKHFQEASQYIYRMKDEPINE